MNIQVQILQYLEQMRTETLTILMTTITMMAESLFIVSIVALLYWCVDKVKSIRLAWIILFNTAINGTIKNLIKMPRPFQVGAVSPIRVQTATSYSFPSGHTQSATSFWGGSMLILKSKKSIWIGSIFILLTGFSRLYLGVHWPIDVIGGILFGAITIIISDRLLGDEGIITRWHIIGISIAFILVLLLKVDADLYKGVSALWGMTYGVYLEQKYIHFQPHQHWRTQVIKIIIGIGGVLLLYVGLKKLFPADKLFDMIRYAALLLWISAGAPYVFTKIKQSS